MLEVFLLSVTSGDLSTSRRLKRWSALTNNQNTEQTQTNTVYSMLVLNLWLGNSCWIVWIKQRRARSRYTKICLFISPYQLIWITCINIFLFCEYLFTGTIEFNVSGSYCCSWISALVCLWWAQVQLCIDHKGNIMHALSVRWGHNCESIFHNLCFLQLKGCG